MTYEFGEITALTPKKPSEGLRSTFSPSSTYAYCVVPCCGSLSRETPRIASSKSPVGTTTSTAFDCTSSNDVNCTPAANQLNPCAGWTQSPSALSASTGEAPLPPILLGSAIPESSGNDGTSSCAGILMLRL